MPYFIIVLSTLARFLPHSWNFSPVYGSLLFGGANMKKLDSVWFPALALGASDVVLTKFIYHLHVGWDEPITLMAFVSIAMIGWILQRRFSVGCLAFACLAAPTSFYLISDLGVWLYLGTYPHTWAGLVACYVAAIPYQGRITASTVLFSVILFGAQQAYRARVTKRKHLEAVARGNA